MAQERYSIFYSSRTGNTKMLADAIREALPKDACDAFGTNDTAEPLSERSQVKRSRPRAFAEIGCTYLGCI